MEFVFLVACGVIGWAANHFLPGVWRSLTGKPDLQLFVEVDPAIIWAGAPPWVGASYVVPDVPITSSPPASCPDWYGWARALGGIPGDSTHVEVTLLAGAELTVVVDGVRAQVVRQGPQPPWRHLICGVGGADITPRHIRVDLEGFDVPTTQALDEEGQPAKRLRLSLGKGEVEKLHIIAHADSKDFEWTAEILAIVEGKRRVFPIGSANKPFRTCGTAGLPAHMWAGEGPWQPPLPGEDHTA